MNRIYLDNAATSYPKPPGVLGADRAVTIVQPVGRAAGRRGD